MNLNLLSYLLFFPAMLALAVGVAQTCHKHGRPWMLRLFDDDAAFVDAVNNILLVGCYLVNLGYIALVMANWEPIGSVEQLLGTLAQRMGLIVLALAALHYQNIAVLLIWSRIKQRKQPHGRILMRPN
ncbi:MAG TPA: hypothetical protein PKY96_14245 [Flavobacteriales bacterium]|nr:hypothetical protein [Flavobacteriales bacterium]